MAKTKHNRNASPQNKDSKKPKLPKAEISSNTTSSQPLTLNSNIDNNVLESSKSSSSVEQKAISMIPKNFQSSIVFAPTNQKLKELLIQVANECYDNFTDEMYEIWMLSHLSSLYGNLSYPQQLNMFTNFIVNYVCLDVNGSVLTRKFVKKMDKSNSNSMVFDKEAYLNDYGDRFNAFVTLRFIIAHLQGNLEMEIDSYGYVQRPNRFGNKTVQELERIAQSITEKEQQAARETKKRMEEGFSNKHYDFGNFKNDSNSNHHIKDVLRIFNEKFKDIPADKIEDPEDIRFFHRKIIANAFEATNPSVFNKTLYKCQDLSVWKYVLEIIFRSFVPFFKDEVFFFVETRFNPIDKGWMGLVNYVDQNTKLFKKVYKPTMLHRDLNKLQFVLSRSKLFSREASEIYASCLLPLIDYNLEILPSREKTAVFSEFIYNQEMVNNGLSFDNPQDRLRGFMFAMKKHKEQKFKFINRYNPISIKVSNKLKPIQNHLPKCAYCHKIMNKSRQCSKCLTVNYCSSECQANDFPEHKHSCASLAALKPFSVDELRSLAKN